MVAIDNAKASRSAIGRMTLILDAFQDDLEVSQNDIVTRTGLPKSTVHRTIGLLVEYGWLHRLGDRYRLGTRLFELGGRVASTSRLRDVAIPFLEDLYEASHEIVNLGVLNGTSVLFVDKIGSHRQIKAPSRPGLRFPANCTAMGKVMLAFASSDLVDAACADLRTQTARSITDPARFRRQLDEIKQAELAIDDEEFEVGMRCCAAPIRGSGRAVAAISVTGPKERIDVDKLGPLVRKTAAGISGAYLG